MNTSTAPYHVVDLSVGRRVMNSMLDLPGVKHCMYDLLEVDVTVARQFIAEHKRGTGEALSFTGFLTFCVAHVVDENKEMQAYLKGRKQLVVFDDVDVGVMVEHQAGENKVLMGHVIRCANHKTYREIHEEIRSIQSTPLTPKRGLPTWFRTAMLLPWPLSSLFISLLGMTTHHNPTISASMGGTVGITAVGMFGESLSGWGIGPLTNYSLGLLVGSIACKPAVVDGRVEPRQILNLTLVYDRNVIDEALAAHFIHRLVEQIESGYGLDVN